MSLDDATVPLPSGVHLRCLRRLDEPRGAFMKILMREHLGESDSFGEIYMTTGLDGGVRGGHFHRRTSEWFCLLQGECNLWLQSASGAEPPVSLRLSGERPCVVFVPPEIAHAFQHVGESAFWLLAYSDTPYNPNDTDTFAYPLPPLDVDDEHS